jgi:alkaline phosphatase D
MIMKLSAAFLLLALKNGNNDVVHAVNSTELPITTTDVFIQSGEVSDSSINIMARCNHEEVSTMKLMINRSEESSVEALASTDYTHTFVVGGLSSSSTYTYKVMCGDLESMEGSFTTAPGPNDPAAINFVWVADLAGQGYGRNPDFEVPHVDGTTMKGGYIVFETMQKLTPDFALFQGEKTNLVLIRMVHFCV